MTIKTFPQFRPVADHALLVEFGETIRDETHVAALQLDDALRRRPFEGFVEAVPAYVNVLIEFDPMVSDAAAARAAVEALLAEPPTARPGAGLCEAQICYDGDLAPDLDAVAERTGMSREAVIAAHLAGDYGVFMYGFAPGYAYLAGVPEAIRLARKSAPVRGVEAGSVIIAGPQCLITTLKMPTGWWIIGRSPTRVLTGDPDRPFLFNVGDRVRFRRISREEFERGSQNGHG